MATSGVSETARPWISMEGSCSFYKLYSFRGSCVSLSDSNGDLLFYAHTRAGVSGITTGLIFNSTHQLLLDGDSIAGGGWYQEMVIIPNPADDSSFTSSQLVLQINSG
ncbi:MAG: hypothetical protein IPN54_04665 [Bacteroidetes bacterium]|nr:hypothetical protein [Bacteroidota bacterium]